MDPRSTFSHQTVMSTETLDAVAPESRGIYADVTLGGGGHAEALLERSSPEGRLFGVDRDPAALDAARTRLERFGERATLVHGRFGDLPSLLEQHGIDHLDGLVADVGVSSHQLDVAARGFSFRNEGPLDMRMDPTRGETAKECIERTDEDDLANLIYELGEERKSRRIARALKDAADRGAMETTEDLRTAVHKAVGGRRGRIDPATRTFQALRIAVNAELDELRALTEALPGVLSDGGVAALISFHSLEDRIVKRAFRGDRRLQPLTKRPLIASDEEREANPRSRSAKLRAARRLPREAS